MTFDEFISKWTNTSVDFDGVYPNQCMDLMHQYVYDVLGITDASVLAHPAAYQVFTEFSESQYFDKIEKICIEYHFVDTKPHLLENMIKKLKILSYTIDTRKILPSIGFLYAKKS